MPNIVYIATSLDGFIATSDHGLDWLNEIENPDNSDYGYAEFMSGIDALVMGRNTFEVVLGFGAWPYEKPVFVLSRTLTEIPTNLSGKAEIVNGDLKQIISQLQERGYHSLYIDGGGTIQSFLAEDLIDTLIITRVPILLGSGIPLFGQDSPTLKFRHEKTESFDNGLVTSTYSRER